MTIFETLRTEEEVDALESKAIESEEQTKFPGMSYEAGIRAAIDFLRDENLTIEEILG